MIATLQGKPDIKAVKRSNGETQSNGSNGSVSVKPDEDMVENIEVKDEPLVEAIDQFNQYGQPHSEDAVGQEDGAASGNTGQAFEIEPIIARGRSLAFERQGSEPADPDSPSPIFTDQQAFLIALAFRSLALLSQTFFQPDEFYQALEPAHWLVFGTGFLSWEWKDLPAVSEETIRAIIEQGGWRSKLVGLVNAQAGGRLRSWLWPGLFAAVYKVLQVTGLDETRLIVRPLPSHSRQLHLKSEMSCLCSCSSFLQLSASRLAYHASCLLHLRIYTRLSSLEESCQAELKRLYVQSLLQLPSRARTHHACQ